jgi:HEPN domain-containing protein
VRVPEELRRERVDKTKFRIYLQKAEEFLMTAKDESERGRYNSAASSAAHAAINALDAITIYLSGYRHAGQRHEDAWKLLKYAEGLPDKSAAEGKFKTAVRVKSIAEYEGRPAGKDEALRALKAAEGLLSWVKGNIGVKG